MRIDLGLLKKCMDKINAQIEQYYITVHLSLGLKDFLDNSDLGCRFVAAEKTLKLKKEKTEINPDLIFQYDNDNYGIISEIKSTITESDNHAANEIFEQIKKYDKSIIGWDTKDEEIKNHDIISFIHSIDSDRYVEVFNDCVQNGDLKLEHNYCIAEFSSLQKSPKPGEGDIILIKYKKGDIGYEPLKKELIKNIRIIIDRLSNLYDRCKFVRKKPPIEYIMNQLWIIIFPALAGKNLESDEITVTIEDLLRISLEYYTSWSGIPGESSQLRTSWVKEAMEEFENIELAKKINESPLTYKVFIRKYGLPKNMREYIIKETCKKEIIKSNKKYLSEKQTTLV